MAGVLRTVAVLSGLLAVHGVPVLDWASHPVTADDTVLVLGGPFQNDSKITLTPLSSLSQETDAVDITPSQVTQASIHVFAVHLVLWRAVST